MPAFAKWVASDNPPKALGRADNGTVFFYGFDEIGTAGWCESAVASDPRANTDLVHSDGENQHVPGKLNQPQHPIFNHGLLGWASVGGNGEIFFSKRRDNRSIERAIAS